MKWLIICSAVNFSIGGVKHVIMFCEIGCRWFFLIVFHCRILLLTAVRIRPVDKKCNVVVQSDIWKMSKLGTKSLFFLFCHCELGRQMRNLNYVWVRSKQGVYRKTIPASVLTSYNA
jgi:hypothetical protein